MITIKNHTATFSHDYAVQTTRSEFEDNTEYVSISLHASELDLKQNTRTVKTSDREYKVKTLTARDENGNKVSLTIFFDK